MAQEFFQVDLKFSGLPTTKLRICVSIMPRQVYFFFFDEGAGSAVGVVFKEGQDGFFPAGIDLFHQAVPLIVFGLDDFSIGCRSCRIDFVSDVGRVLVETTVLSTMLSCVRRERERVRATNHLVIALPPLP
jgi:hypothetical protein